MKKLTLLLVLSIVTGLGIAFHRAGSGDAAAARAAVPPPRIDLDRTVEPPTDLAQVILERGRKLLAQGKRPQAAAHFRACLALEGATGDEATFRAARAGLEQTAPRQVRKATVARLAEKVIAPEPAVEPVEPRRPRATLAVGPDGVIYETAP